jgi:hypothetical protein
MRTTVRKAVAAGVGAGVTGLGTAMLDGVLTPAEGIVAAGLALCAAGAAWAVKYQVPAAAPARRR